VKKKTSMTETSSFITNLSFDEAYAVHILRMKTDESKIYYSGKKWPISSPKPRIKKSP
jgi:hypothetical protein